MAISTDSSRAHCCVNEMIFCTFSCTQQDGVTENRERKLSNWSYTLESRHYFVTVPGRWGVGGVSLPIMHTKIHTSVTYIKFIM